MKKKVEFNLGTKKVKGIYGYFDQNRNAHLIVLPLDSPYQVGWIISNQNKDFDILVKNLPEFSKEEILNSQFYYVKEYEILDKEEDKMNKSEDKMMKSSEKNASSDLLTYTKDVTSDGLRLALAGKLIEKVKEAFIKFVVQDYLDRKIHKNEDQNLAEAQKWAAEFLSGKLGSCFIGLVLGAIIKGGGIIAGDYAELLRHPEVQEFARTIHVRTVMEGGDFFLDQIEGLIRPLVNGLMGASSNLRVFAEELNSAEHSNEETHQEEKALQEAKDAEKPAKKTLVAQA